MDMNPKGFRPFNPARQNSERAREAWDLLEIYSRRTYGETTPTPEALIDLLVDHYHLADREGWNLEALFQRAREHYHDELMGPGEITRATLVRAASRSSPPIFD